MDAPHSPTESNESDPSATAVRLTRRQALGLGLGGLAVALLAGSGSRLGDGAGRMSVVPQHDAGPASSVPATAPIKVIDPSEVAQANAGRTPMQWGMSVPGVHTRLADAGLPEAPTLALTFDACGGPGGSGVDDALLALLEREQIPATLFLNQRWIEANRALAERLAATPLFEIGNHGSRHVPLSVTGRSAYGIAGTVNASEAAIEVWTNHELLTELLGRPPRWFRSGTAHYDEVAASIAVQLGEQPVGFTTNGDAGATASAASVNAALVGTAAGGIVLAHMNRPKGRTAVGLAAALPRLRARGTRFVTLSQGGGTAA